MNVLITGASGMIGHTLARIISQSTLYRVIGVGQRPKSLINGLGNAQYYQFGDLTNKQNTEKLFAEFKPEIIINCAGLTKHIEIGNVPKYAIELNALFPHVLADYASRNSCRLVHISSDCVFNGEDGDYTESSITNAYDVYGKTKALGEVEGDHLTLRTSTIGHEQGTSFGLLEWFLKQSECEGYPHAIFSGLPTVELGQLIRDFVLPNQSLSGLFNVGASPIDKYSLLNLIADQYGLSTSIISNGTFTIDRSLNSMKFTNETGYVAPDWPILISKMFSENIGM